MQFGNRNLFNLLLISNIPFGIYAPASIPAAWGSVFCTITLPTPTTTSRSWLLGLDTWSESLT